MKILTAVIISVVVTLGILKWYSDYRSAQYVAAAYIAEGLALATNIKHEIAYFYAENGRFPSSNEELGLPAPEQFVGQSLSRLAVSDGGVIAITFNHLSGIKDGVIRLLPDGSNPAMGLQWRCETPSYKNIGEWAPQCKYTPESASGQQAGRKSDSAIQMMPAFVLLGKKVSCGKLTLSIN